MKSRSIGGGAGTTGTAGAAVPAGAVVVGALVRATAAALDSVADDDRAVEVLGAADGARATGALDSGSSGKGANGILADADNADDARPPADAFDSGAANGSGAGAFEAADVARAMGALVSCGDDGAVEAVGAAAVVRATGAVAAVGFPVDGAGAAALGAGDEESDEGAVPFGAGVEPLVGPRSATGPRGPVVFCGAELVFCAAASSRAFALACAAAASLSRASAITGGDDVASPALRTGAAGATTGFCPCVAFDCAEAPPADGCVALACAWMLLAEP
jgi:hypothetical protein